MKPPFQLAPGGGNRLTGFREKLRAALGYEVQKIERLPPSNPRRKPTLARVKFLEDPNAGRRP